MILSVVKGKRSKKEFRRQFRRSLRRCVRKGVSVEECFGIVWEEMVEQTELPESEHPKLYGELLAWARSFKGKD
ncbi:MAG: hypothetical protein HYY23_02690 [Verrucomicrobia bacterium]|nr:hypothetical protein [Verrucomicrobiota bacterium]